MHTLRFWLTGVLIVLLAWLGFAYTHRRAMQRAAMYNARMFLHTAYTDYERTGTLPTSKGHAQLSVFTNTVAVRGTNYQCALAVDWFYFSGRGVLAITTNRTVLWIDKERAPKIIDDGYRTPLFSRGV